MQRFQRSLVLGALGTLSLLGVQSCASIQGVDFLPCATGDSVKSGVAPCDIYGAAKTPCVAAFSTARRLYAGYAGPLYEVTRASDTATLNVGLLSDGYADAASQDTFCAGTTCTITRIFDQSPRHNDLSVAPAGTASRGSGPGGEDLPAAADSLAVNAGGHKVYGIFLSAGMGYRNDATKGIAINGESEGVYMVGSGTHVNSGCCFDFGNAETDSHNHGQGHMDALRLLCDSFCNPEVGLDMEDGTYPPFPVPSGMTFVTAMGVNDGQRSYAVYWGNAQDGCLVTSDSRPLPAAGYMPMHQEGAIILGIGGDNSNWSEGSFFEGAMTAGAPSNATLSAVQANVVSAGYAAVPQP